MGIFSRDRSFDEQFNQRDGHRVGADTPAASGTNGNTLGMAPTGNQPMEDGDKLLGEVVGAVGRYVVLPDGAADLCALFVVHAHALDCAQFSPILAVESPAPGCGKTTLLRVLRALTPLPLSTANITPAGLFRNIALQRRTLFFDEAEASVLRDGALCGILNSGHCRDGAAVVRADGVFGTWCAKVIALIGELPPSLRERSIRVGLQRKRPDERVALLDEPGLAHLKMLNERVAQWSTAARDQLVAVTPASPPELTNRAADNWRPLLAIAEVAAGSWPNSARRIAVSASAGAHTDISPGVALLRDLRRVFNALVTARVSTADLIRELASMDDRPWAEWNRGRPITPAQIAAILKPWRISPKTIRFESGLAKGYVMVDCADAFARYL
jgi:hypothetical protein